MRRTCQLPGCHNIHEARGWCAAHYYRWHRYGNPLGTPLQRPRGGRVRVPLSQVYPDRRAAAWASQVRFDRALERLR